MPPCCFVMLFPCFGGFHEIKMKLQEMILLPKENNYWYAPCIFLRVKSNIHLHFAHGKEDMLMFLPFAPDQRRVHFLHKTKFVIPQLNRSSLLPCSFSLYKVSSLSGEHTYVMLYTLLTDNLAESVSSNVRLVCFSLAQGKYLELHVRFINCLQFPKRYFAPSKKAIWLNERHVSPHSLG